MRFWAGVTDNAWFSFLSQPAPDEVNFWQPGALQPTLRWSRERYSRSSPNHRKQGLRRPLRVRRTDGPD